MGSLSRAPPDPHCRSAATHRRRRRGRARVGCVHGRRRPFGRRRGLAADVAAARDERGLLRLHRRRRHRGAGSRSRVVRAPSSPVVNDTGAPLPPPACTCSTRVTVARTTWTVVGSAAVPDGAQAECHGGARAGARGQARRARRVAVRWRGLRRVRAAATGSTPREAPSSSRRRGRRSWPSPGSSRRPTPAPSPRRRHRRSATSSRPPRAPSRRSCSFARGGATAPIDPVISSCSPRSRTSSGTAGCPHSGPWDYVAEVPLLLYGPGYIRAQGAVDRTVTLADIAPTQGELVGFEFDAPDGAPLTEALVPTGAPDRSAEARRRGRVGRRRPGRARRLAERVARARGHDRPGHVVRPGRGRLLAAEHGADPRHDRHRGLLARPRHRRARAAHRRPAHRPVGSRARATSSPPPSPTCTTDAMGNRPVVGALATVAIHLGMMGHGSLWGGGDQDIAVLREREGAATLGAEGISWNLTSERRPVLPAART